MKPPNPPPLGDHDVAAQGRVCCRDLDWPNAKLCGKEPFLHVLWDDEMENGFVCTDHVAELDRKNWIPVDQHEVGPDCGMPGAFWSFDEKRCYVPDQGDEAAVESRVPVLAGAENRHSESA